MSDALPTLAQSARTFLAQARIGSLVCRGPGGGAGNLTVVHVTDQPDGQPLVLVERSSPVARQLAHCPIATLAVSAAAPYQALHLTGRATRVPDEDPDDSGFVSHRLTLLSARLIGVTPGSEARTVPVAQFRDASPDPLWQHAPATLAHLAESHHGELLACVRAHGVIDAQGVVPTHLDSYGLQLAVIGPDGVATIRLRFPDAPVSSMDEVAQGIRALMTCRCHTCTRPDPTARP